jgi:hypothetical protein
MYITGGLENRNGNCGWNQREWPRDAIGTTQVTDIVGC